MQNAKIIDKRQSKTNAELQSQIEQLIICLFRGSQTVEYEFAWWARKPWPTSSPKSASV